MVKNEPETAVAVRREPENPLAFLDSAKPLPELMIGRVDGTSWARTLLLGEKYREPNPDFLAKRMLGMQLNAANLYGALEGREMVKLQQWVPDASGASTGPIKLLDVYVAPSKVSETPATWVIIDALRMPTGEAVTFSTGATAVQGFILKALVLGIWPVDCQIQRTDRIDKGGRHAFGVFPID